MKLFCYLACLLMVSSQLIGCEDSCCSTSVVQLGGSYTYADIKVDGQPKFHGNLGGAQGSYEFKGTNGLYAGARVTWKEGSLDSSWGDRKYTYVDAQERLGYVFTNACWDLSGTLFTGFGYRYNGHRLSQDEQPKVKFEYNEFYIPVGLLTNYSIFCWCDVGLNVLWMPQVYSTVEIEPLRGAHWSLKNTMNNWQVKLPITVYPCENECFSVIFKPFYERWEDGRSTAKTLGGKELGLPRNLYNFWGIEVNIGFTF